MTQTFLSSAEDMAWLAEVHCDLAIGYKCAVLYGNEDCPQKVELYLKNDVSCVPTVLVIGEDNNLRVESVGWFRKNGRIVKPKPKNGEQHG